MTEEEPKTIEAVSDKYFKAFLRDTKEDNTIKPADRLILEKVCQLLKSNEFKSYNYNKACPVIYCEEIWIYITARGVFVDIIKNNPRINDLMTILKKNFKLNRITPGSYMLAKTYKLTPKVPAEPKKDDDTDTIGGIVVEIKNDLKKAKKPDSKL